MKGVGGLDPSLRSTGIATHDGTLLTLKTHKMRGTERLIHIRDEVVKALWDCEMVAIEGMSFGSHGRAVFDLGGLGWILRVALTEAEIQWVDVSPGQLKKYATGHGRASKQQMIKASKERGYEPKNDDEADASLLRAWILRA